MTLGLTSMQGGFWGRQQSAFFDVRVFHPNALSHRTTQIASLFRRYELESMDIMCKLLNLLHLVFSTFGGLGREATIFYSCLADLLTSKHSSDFGHELSLMCCTLSFSLLRTLYNLGHQGS